MYNDKYIKTKISLNTYFFNNKRPKENKRNAFLYAKTKISLNTNFFNNKRPKENKRNAFLYVIILDSIINVDKKYYPPVFWRKWKYSTKKWRIKLR